MKRALLLSLLLVVSGCNQSGTTISSAPNTAQSSSHSSTMENDWPFDDPENFAVITLDRIVNDAAPILYVTHDADDGGWQFLDGGDVTEQNAMVVSLREIAESDATIKQLADLPLGWFAVRKAIGEPWQRKQQEH